MNNYIANNTNNNAGLYTLSLRWVIGWTYFSAFWRRLVLENKLTQDEVGYIGEKFNHFLPNALGIKPIIEHLVTHPDQLHTAMVVFTLVEAVVGLFLILGFFTRAMSLGVVGLAMGILLGSGWLGTTCLDEWQIGVLGVAGGFTLFLSGSDSYSLDKYFLNKNFLFTKSKWFSWAAFGAFPIRKNLKPLVLFVSILILGLTLFTNQYFHGGVYGKLHNKSVKPKIEISNIKLSSSELKFEIYRTEGADVYGSFLIGIHLVDENEKVVKAWTMEDLSKFNKDDIHNYYVTKVKPGAHSLIIPLGAKADVTLKLESTVVNKNHKLKLIDISGLIWEKAIL